MGRRLDRFFAALAAGYMRFVYFSGKITREGRVELLDGDEAFAVGFWHGVSYCYFPQLQHRGDIIITTVNRRGDIVELIGRKFGYVPVRLPDESDPDASLTALRRMLDAAKGQNICFPMDGPLGPYHIPKRFFLTVALLSKKRILPVSVEVRRKIVLKKRWDKYIIPLPFARIKFTFHDPLEVKKRGFDEAAERILEVMDGE
jgi:lysophospholipid acyltransferase (LPLAT)-like uncharacterized protein